MTAKNRVFLLLVLIIVTVQHIHCSSVTYDRKSLIINGQRRILLSGSIHYPRSTPEMWEGLIQKAKDGGLDAIDTYVFWNIHEPTPGNYDFQGRNDLVRFLKLIQSAGMYVHLRIGPYICGEWKFGGIPVWLKYVPGSTFRSNSEPFKRAMQGFVQKIVQMMKDESLFHSQGGPIILSQIENEYGLASKAYGAAGHDYMIWAAQMAVDLNTGVPWVMCKEDDAPDSVINTCNGFYCDYFTPNNPNKPIMWTEAWTGWFEDFGSPIHHRPVEDLAFAVARFIQKGGSFVNYYMYHGGTNFGRTAGGPFLTTSYDYDAPIDEYGLARQPKYDHLKAFHNAIKQSEIALLNANPTVTRLGSYQEAHMFSSPTGGCAAFLSNFHLNSSANVTFNNMHYTLPPWSASILPDCKTAVFNTAVVGAKRSVVQMSLSGLPTLSWETFTEDVSDIETDSKLTVSGLLDQLSVTRDSSDYLWYITSVEISPSDEGQQQVLEVSSAGHALHVFINGLYSGSAYGSKEHPQFTYNTSVSLQPGTNKVSLLSVAIGLRNDGPHFEATKTGILGPVKLQGLDLSAQKWTYQVGLRGEAIPTGTSSVQWVELSPQVAQPQQKPLTWYKAYFNSPEGNDSLGLDMGSMIKGEVWINGQSIGRYWTLTAAGNCGSCSYEGAYRSPKCLSGCGHPTQRWYHVPRSWLKPTENLLVVFEEVGGDASKISLVKRTLTYV